MSAEARVVVNRWLSEQGKRDPENLSPEDYAELRTLLAPHKGFGVFWSMIAFERTMYEAALKNTNLGTDEGRAEAAKMQGFLLAIDNFHETILSIADPLESAAAPAGEKQENE